jgi:hypothetical protein
MVKKLQARNEPRRGRGFAFIDFASEAQQQKAVAGMNTKEIGGRAITVRVAVDGPDHTDDDASGSVPAAVENVLLKSNSVTDVPAETELAIQDTDENLLTSGPQTEAPALDTPINTNENEKEQSATADQFLEAALQDAVRAEVAGQEQDDRSEIDTEDFYAPDPNQLAPDSNVIQAEHNRSSSYSPRLGNKTPAPEDSESVGDYEPPEAASPIKSPSFSPEPPQSVERNSEESAVDNTSLVLTEAEDDSVAVDEGEVSDTTSAMDIETSSVQDIDLDNSLPQPNGSVPLSTQVKNISIPRSFVC